MGWGQELPSPSLLTVITERSLFIVVVVVVVSGG